MQVLEPDPVPQDVQPLLPLFFWNMTPSEGVQARALNDDRSHGEVPAVPAKAPDT